MEIDLTVIIPCYNEEAVLSETYDRVKKVLDQYFPSHELLFINDGSEDSTLAMLKGFCDKDERTSLISFSRNFGHESATTAGIHHARGRRAFIIDADLQDPPELFSEMYEEMNSRRCNILYGVRKSRDGEGVFKKSTSKLFYRFINTLSDRKMPLDTGDFRLIDRKVMDAFKLYTEKNKYVRGIYAELGFDQKPFYYHREARVGGETKYNIRKLIILAMDVVFYYSNKPLQLSINLGVISIFAAIILTGYAIHGHYTNNTPGWASSVIITLYLGGVQLFILGIIGKYLGNIFNEVKGRPSYIVDEYINGGNNETI